MQVTNPNKVLTSGLTLREHLVSQALLGLAPMDAPIMGVANDAVSMADLVIDVMNGIDIDARSKGGQEMAAQVAANIKSINEG